MRTTFLPVGTAILLLLTCWSGAEAGPPDRDLGARSGGGRFAEALSLSPDQQEQMRGLRQQMREQMRGLGEQGADLRGQAKSLRETHRQRVHAILTTQQVQTLERLRAEHPEGGRDRGKRPGLHRRPRAKLGQVLGLTTQQKEAMRTLRAGHREQMQALRASDEASEQQVRALRSQHHEQVLELLTDEQQSTMEQWRARRPSGRPGRGLRVPPSITPEPLPGGDSASKPSVESESWGEVKKSTD